MSPLTSPDPATSPAPQTAPRRFPILVWVLAFILVAVVSVVTYQNVRHARAASKLEKYALAPQFTFTAQDGRLVSTADLKGKVWVANFIFTRCNGPCPVMTGHMAELNQKLGPELKDVELVSITVDPEYDTPAVLKEYGDRVHASPDRWKFLTGSADAIQNTVIKGFLQPLSKDRDGSPMHSTRFVLVDRNGWIRGFQDGSDPNVAELLAKDVQTLRHE